MSSLNKRKWVRDKAMDVKSRISYIRKISEGLRFTPQLFPRPDEERLYQKALAHVVHLLSSKTCTLSSSGKKQGTAMRDKEGDLCNKNEYVECMKDILSKLQYMERSRLYDPPSDHEIGYYLLIKRYVRPMFSFCESQTWTFKLPAPLTSGRDLLCFSPLTPLHFVEELEEVNGHIKHISTSLSEMAFGNEYSVKQLLGESTMEKDEATPPVFCGSNGKSNMFYHHKFMLALIDLRSSHHAYSPPSPEEKECFDQVLCHIEPPSSHSVKDNVDVYSDDLKDLFVKRLHCDVVRFNEDCRRIMLKILKKVSIHFSQEAFLKIYIAGDDDLKEQDEAVVFCLRELVEKCNISCDDLPAYIKSLDQAIEIMFYIRTLSDSLYTPSFVVADLIKGSSKELCDSEDSISWEALHALTLFSQGSSFPVKEVGERNTMQCFSQGKKKPQVEKDAKENVETLKVILEELRGVGDWGLKPPPTNQEHWVVGRIWRSLVCSVNFFNCTMAYQQRTDHIEIGQTYAARRRASKTEGCVERECPINLCAGFLGFRTRVNILRFILQVFKDSLIEKLSKFSLDVRQPEEV